MSAWLRWTSWADRLAALRSKASRHALCPGRGIASPLRLCHRLAFSSKGGIDDPDYKAVVVRSARRTTGRAESDKLKQPGLERVRASAKARKEVPSSPDALVVDEPPSAAPLGVLMKRAYQQIIHVPHKIRKCRDLLRIRREQKVARRSRIQFTRKCLGLPIKDGSIVKGPQITEEGRDVVLVAIDTEGGSKSVTEVGIAALDTTILAGLSPGPKAREWRKKIRTRHFDTRPQSGRFKFGITERVPQAALRPYIQSLISPTRKYVLVGHSLSGDLDKLVPILGFDLRRLPNVVGHLDTLDFVQGLPMPQKLSTLWKHLTGMVEPDSDATAPFAFHNAGNDAVYNLQVLLMLATSPEAEWMNPVPGESFTGVLPRFHAVNVPGKVGSVARLEIDRTSGKLGAP